MTDTLLMHDKIGLRQVTSSCLYICHDTQAMAVPILQIVIHFVWLDLVTVIGCHRVLFGSSLFDTPKTPSFWRMEF